LINRTFKFVSSHNENTQVSDFVNPVKLSAIQCDYSYAFVYLFNYSEKLLTVLLVGFYGWLSQITYNASLCTYLFFTHHNGSGK